MPQQKTKVFESVKRQLLARTNLSCHMLLLISYLWLAKCSHESIALITGYPQIAVLDWIFSCLQNIIEEVKQDISVLLHDEQILIAERVWRRNHSENLWVAFLDTVFKPIYNAVEIEAHAVDDIRDVITGGIDECSLVAKFETMGLRDELVDGIVAVGISDGRIGVSSTNSVLME